MIAVQVALTLLMLTAAGAAGKGFLRLANADLGYDPQNTMSLPIPVHDGTYQTWKERSEYFERLRAAVAAMPQVVSAGISTNATPPSNGGDTTSRSVAAARSKSRSPASNFISPEYFPLLRIPLAQGRLWNERRNQARSGARRHQPDDGAAVLAERRRDRPSGPVREHEGRTAILAGAVGAGGWLQIIGVVADARNDGLRNPIKSGVLRARTR